MLACKFTLTFNVHVHPFQLAHSVTMSSSKRIATRLRTRRTLYRSARRTDAILVGRALHTERQFPVENSAQPEEPPHLFNGDNEGKYEASINGSKTARLSKKHASGLFKRYQFQPHDPINGLPMALALLREAEARYGKANEFIFPKVRQLWFTLLGFDLQVIRTTKSPHNTFHTS